MFSLNITDLLDFKYYENTSYVELKLISLLPFTRPHRRYFLKWRLKPLLGTNLYLHCCCNYKIFSHNSLFRCLKTKSGIVHKIVHTTVRLYLLLWNLPQVCWKRPHCEAGDWKMFKVLFSKKWCCIAMKILFSFFTLKLGEMESRHLIFFPFVLFFF